MDRTCQMLLTGVLIACRWQLAYSDTESDSCSAVNVGGLMCVAHCKLMGKDRSVVCEFKHLLCTLTDKTGQLWVKGMDRPKQIKLTGNDDGHLALGKNKQGHVTEMAERHDQYLKTGMVFSWITSSLSKSCLLSGENEESMKNTPTNVTAEILEKGYALFGAGETTLYVKRFSSKKTWDEALSTCQSDKGSLVKIDTSEKMAYIKQKLSVPQDKINSFYMWIGVRDFDRDNVYRWTDRSNISYSSWHKREPSFKDRLMNGSWVEEDCVAMTNHMWKGLSWNDKHCTMKNGFICEIDLNQVSLRLR